MQKTKLGISVGLTGAALYFLGAISFIPAFLLAGYVLLFEENDWLKKAAVKMISVVVVMGILSMCVGLVQDAFGIVSLALNWVKFIDFKVPLNLDRMILYVIGFMENALLLLMGFRALSMGTVKSGYFDKIITKHM